MISTRLLSLNLSTSRAYVDSDKNEMAKLYDFSLGDHCYFVDILFNLQFSGVLGQVL